MSDDENEAVEETKRIEAARAAHAAPVDGAINSFCLERDDICRALNTDFNQGLKSGEAKRRLQEYGPNELPAKEGTPLWVRFLEQFDDKLVKILLAAALISLLLALENTFKSIYNGEGIWDPLTVAFYEGEFVEAFVIMLILVCNAIVGVWQESNADAAIEALKEYAAPLATVIRDGQRQTIPAVQLVPGDVAEVACGDKIPADIRLLHINGTALKSEQDALTGESLAVNKQSEIVEPGADKVSQKNMLFSGADVAYGSGRGIVVLTGPWTYIGTIHSRLSEGGKDKESPLKKKLDDFGDVLTNVIMGICVLVWLININHFTEGNKPWIRGAVYYFKIAVALAVAAIPEGLPAVVTTCLALGTRRMAKKNAIVRHLPSVETLGCTQVICSDKTGTLTTNQMSVLRVLTMSSQAGFTEYDVEGSTFEPKGDLYTLEGSSRGAKVAGRKPDLLYSVGRICSLCNQSSLEFNTEKQVWQRVGESTEAALKVLSEKIGVPDATYAPPRGSRTPADEYWRSKHASIATLEFARDRKSMSVLIGDPSAAPDSAARGDGPRTRSQMRSSTTPTATGALELVVKGAPEGILHRCTRVALPGGGTAALTDDTKRRLLRTIEEEYGGGLHALRCLALAVAPAPRGGAHDPLLSDPANFAQVESNMTFVGIVGIRDPPRMEVAGAISKCHQAGIRVIVITGDNKKTAEAICRQIGIFEPDEDLTGKSFTGEEFSRMSEREKRDAVAHASLFSRTEPAHKQDLVKLLQDDGNGLVTAMTGDGVNDAPALKAADIGVAMGTGTAVAKEASKMVLADDNFITIVNAVEEGRAIYNNTKAFIRYLISSNIGEVVCIFLGTVLGVPEALVPITLLWVNLVTDGLPATALSFNPPESDVMTKPPRRRNEDIVDRWGFFRYMVIGIYVGFATVFGYIWWQLWYDQGPLVTYSQLTSWGKCTTADPKWEMANGFDCQTKGANPFEDKRPMTVSLSILVTIEMFNALNALAENESLLTTPPWVNPWLIGAVVLSFSQHFLILGFDRLASVFGVAWLTWEEWKFVIAISFPIIILDELLKLVARIRESASARHVDASKKEG